MEPVLKKSITYPRLVENNSQVEHPEHQNRVTSVAHIYEKFRTGKIEDMPHTSLPQMPDDNRSDDEMLKDEFILGLNTTNVDVMNRYAEVLERVKEDLKKLKLSKDNRKRYEDALDVLESPSSTSADKVKAYQAIEELRKSARAT